MFKVNVTLLNPQDWLSTYNVPGPIICTYILKSFEHFNVTANLILIKFLFTFSCEFTSYVQNECSFTYYSGFILYIHCTSKHCLHLCFEKFWSIQWNTKFNTIKFSCEFTLHVQKEYKFQCFSSYCNHSDELSAHW